AIAEPEHGAVAEDSHLARGVLVHDVDPLRLRHADAALDRTAIRAGGLASRPFEELRADAPLSCTCACIVSVARVDAIAERERIGADFDGELIERLLEREDALRLPRSAKRRARSRVHEDVVVLGLRVRRRIHRPDREANARAGCDAAGAEA